MIKDRYYHMDEWLYSKSRLNTFLLQYILKNDYVESSTEDAKALKLSQIKKENINKIGLFLNQKHKSFAIYPTIDHKYHHRYQEITRHEFMEKFYKNFKLCRK